MQNENKPDIFKDIEIDHAVKDQLRSMASWAMVSVTMAVIGYVISLLQVFGGKQEIAGRSEGFDLTLSLGGSEKISTVVTVVIGLLLNYFLFRFASQAKKGMDSLNQQELNCSFNNLKIYFMATSIIMIIVFLLVLLSMLVLSTSDYN